MHQQKTLFFMANKTVTFFLSQSKHQILRNNNNNITVDFSHKQFKTNDVLK